MTPKENCNENLRKSISGIFEKKFMGTHCNALHICQYMVENSYGEEFPGISKFAIFQVGFSWVLNLFS
jgi:hypothetical protein